MAIRTIPALVQAILGSNYGAVRDNTTGLLTNPDLTPYITIASSIIDQAVPIQQDLGFVYTDGPAPSQLEIQERWLSAFFYCLMDPMYMSKSTSGASGGFQRKQGEGFEANEYGKAACNADVSGVLTAIGKRQVAGGVWLGQCPADAQPTCYCTGQGPA
jgi:hypothetical protein